MHASKAAETVHTVNQTGNTLDQEKD